MANQIKIVKEKQFINKSYGEYVVSEKWKEHRSAAYFDYRRKWYENPEKMILEDFPIHLDIEVTSFCNLACPMCPRTIQLKEGTFPSVKHMDLNLYKKLIKEGAENGLASIKLNYLGEPLMHPNILEIVKFSKQQGIVEVMFNTNGVLLTEKMSKALLDAGIDSLFISFDSAYKEKYESIRIGAKYEHVLENVKRFCDIKNNDPRYAHVQVRVSKVVFPEETEEDLKAFVELWEEKADSVGFASLQEELQDADIPYDPSFRCDQPWQRFFVRQDGVSFVCCADKRSQYNLGNANQVSIKEMWHGEKLTKLRKAHSRGRYNEIEMCKNCPYLCSSKVKVEGVQ